MKTKLYIKLLQEMANEPTNIHFLIPTEKQLLEINIKLLSSKYLCVKKCAIEGIESLIKQVNARIGICRIFSTATFKVY